MEKISECPPLALPFPLCQFEFGTEVEFRFLTPICHYEGRTFWGVQMSIYHGNDQDA